MAKEFAKAFYNSKAWRECRKSYIAYRIAIDGGMCENCHNNLGYICHHIIELTPENINDPNIALNHSNLRYDCKHCHDEEDNHFVKRAQEIVGPVIFDPYGNPIGREEAKN